MVVYEKYVVNDDGEGSVFAHAWLSQTFTPQEDQTIGIIKVKVYKAGSPPADLKVELWSTSGGEPDVKLSSFSDILSENVSGSSPGNWLTSTGSQALNGSMQYAIVLHSNDSNSANRYYWRNDFTSPTYANGLLLYSSDYGSSWTDVSSQDMMFETDGVPPPVIPTGRILINISDEWKEILGAKQTAITVISSADDTDVTDVNIIYINPAAAVVLGAFIGGVNGQVLHLVIIADDQDVTLEHNEGTGNQNIFLHAGLDETIDSHFGGWNLVCDGTNWYDASHSKHV